MLSFARVFSKGRVNRHDGSPRPEFGREASHVASPALRAIPDHGARAISSKHTVPKAHVSCFSLMGGVAWDACVWGDESRATSNLAPYLGEIRATGSSLVNRPRQ